MDAKTLFKKLRFDAEFGTSEDTPRPIMTHGSQSRQSDFATGKRPGRFAHLTNDYIDSLSDAELEREMVTFIYRCFQQR